MINEIATFIEGFHFEKAPKKIQMKAKYILIDSIGVMISTVGDSKLTRTNIEKSILTKSFIDAVKLVEEELDEGNSVAKGHPACHFVPALLQIAKEKNLTLEQVMTAFLTGYEVGARIGEITTLKQQIHPHGNWGMIGGAASLAKVYNWDVQKTKQSINISAQLSFPTLWKSVIEGHEIRNVIIGLNNLNLLLIPSLVEAGYSASDETLGIMFSQILGTSFAAEKLNLNKSDYYLEHTYFKFYDSCRFCHGPIDALKQAMKQMEISSIKQIEQIEVATYESASKLNSKHVNNAFAGKFSIPYALAKEAYRYTKEPFEEQDLLKLAKLVEISNDEEINRKLPEIRATKLNLHSDGKAVTTYLETAYGDNETEDLFKFVLEKFYQNVQHLYPKEQAKLFVRKILDDHEFPYELLNKGELV